LTIKAPSGDSAYSMLFTEARGSSHVPATIINEAFGILAPATAVNQSSFDV
jgi:hypothetical protein